MAKNVSVLDGQNLDVTFNVFDSAYELTRLLQSQNGFFATKSLDDLCRSKPSGEQTIVSRLICTLRQLHDAKHSVTAPFSRAYSEAVRAALILSCSGHASKWGAFTQWVREQHVTVFPMHAVESSALASITHHESKLVTFIIAPKDRIWQMSMGQAMTKAMTDLVHFLNLVDADSLPFVVSRDDLSMFRQLIMFVHTTQVGTKLRTVPTSCAAIAKALQSPLGLSKPKEQPHDHG